MVHCFKVLVKGQNTYISSFQFSCSVMSDSVTPWTAARQASLSFTIARTSHQVANVLVHFASASDLSKMLIIPEGAEGRDV